MNGIGGNFAPNILGIEKPQISASRIPTFLPCSEKARASNEAIVDLPTPPFPDAIPIMRLPVLNSFFASSGVLSAPTILLTFNMSSSFGSLKVTSISLFCSLISSLIAERTHSISVKSAISIKFSFFTSIEESSSKERLKPG